MKDHMLFSFYADKKAESRPSESESIYVPRDEELEDTKRESIDQGKLRAVLRNVVPAFKDKIMGGEVVSNVDYFIKEPGHSESKSQAPLPPQRQFMLNLRGAIEEIFKFEPPKLFSSK